MPPRCGCPPESAPRKTATPPHRSTTRPAAAAFVRSPRSRSRISARWSRNRPRWRNPPPNNPSRRKIPRAAFGIHPAVMHAPADDHRQAAADHGFLAIHRALALVPVRLAIAAAAQVRGHLLDPFGIDPRHPPRPQARGFHQFHRHHPFAALGNPEQPGAGKHREKSARRAAIRLVLPVPPAELPRHPG